MINYIILIKEDKDRKLGISTYHGIQPWSILVPVSSSVLLFIYVLTNHTEKACMLHLQSKSVWYGWCIVPYSILRHWYDCTEHTLLYRYVSGTVSES